MKKKPKVFRTKYHFKMFGIDVYFYYGPVEELVKISEKKHSSGEINTNWSGWALNGSVAGTKRAIFIRDDQKTYKGMFNTLVHEINHIVQIICDDLGIKDINHETDSFMIGELFEFLYSKGFWETKSKNKGEKKCQTLNQRNKN